MREELNIPPDEFRMAYGSAEWKKALEAHAQEWNRPERHEARLKAKFKGLSGNTLRLWRLLRSTENCRTGLATGGKGLLHFGRPLEIVLEEARRHEKEFCEELGRLVADDLLAGRDAILKNLEKARVIILAEGLTEERSTLKTDILNAFEALENEWFPKIDWSRPNAGPLVTKAALREQVNPTKEQARDFTRFLKDLGLSKLPERGG